MAGVLLISFLLLLGSGFYGAPEAAMGIGLQHWFYPLYILRLVEMAGEHGFFRAMALWYFYRYVGV